MNGEKGVIMKKTEIFYRESRETLTEALKTEKMFISVYSLKSYLSLKGYKQVEIKFYCYDDRENIGDSFLISGLDKNNNKCVLGFMYLRNGGLI